jgi:hypothetical protein
MISILVSTCDSYHDVLDLFFNSFNEYWPNCKYDIIINGERQLYENKKFNFKIENHLTNDNKWGARLLKSLKAIQNEYVITLLDDYLLDSKFDMLKLNNAISIIQNDEDASCVYLYHLNDLEMLRSDNESFSIVSNNSLYKINTLPSIWKRTELIKILEDQDDPWTWEAFSMYRKSAKKIKIYSVSSKSFNIYNYSAMTGGAVYRGKWVNEVVYDKINKYNLPSDFTKREFLNNNEVAKRSLKWKLNFLLKGFKIANFNVCIFIFKSLKSKFYKKKKR